MKRYIKDGKIKIRNQIVIRKDGMSTYNPTEEMILADGWEEYITPSVPEPTQEELEARRKVREIEREKELLSSTDYKVIKCIESYLCGEELPYDINELHLERQAQRARINELEA
jgi:hypothetical protein